MKNSKALSHISHIICAVVLILSITYLANIKSVHSQQTIQINAPDLIPKTELSFSPTSGTFIQGSTFDVPLYINTKGNVIGAIELHISFDPNVLSVVKPSNGSSIIGLWIETPSYDNTKGSITFIGGVPKGINTSSGLVTTITFQAKNQGKSDLHIQEKSRILISDGSGSPAIFESNTPQYIVSARPPGNVIVNSETHPFHDRWYNNNNPILSWSQDVGVTGYSFVLDKMPNTVPDNTSDTSDTSYSFEDVADGISYFHIKALKNGMWGAPSHYELKIDTTPPAIFKPNINYITAAIINRALVSYFTTDILSGIDHYEVGVINKTKPATESPAFIRGDSPYQIPLDTVENARVIVRAFDRAGNVRDASIDVSAPFLPTKFIRDHAVAILLVILIFIIISGVIHYFYGHHVMRHLRAIWKIISNKKELGKIEDEMDESM